MNLNSRHKVGNVPQIVSHLKYFLENILISENSLKFEKRPAPFQKTNSNLKKGLHLFAV